MDAAESPRVAGLELGGTKCVAILATGPDAILARQSVPTSDPQTTLRALEALLDGWDFDALGVAAFGPLALDPGEPDYGRIVASPKPGWDSIDVLHRFERRYGVPVGLRTDVEGAALAEARWGAAQGMRSHIYVTVGTGVGVAAMLDGRPVRGAGNCEAGHMRIARIAGDDFAGICRFHGDCVEGLVSGPALAARFGADGAQLSDDGPHWQVVVHDLAAMLHNLTVTLMPQRIALGGGVIAGRPFLFPMLRRRLADSLGGYGTTTAWAAGLDRRLGPPGLGDMAGPLGAIAAGIEALAR